MSTKGPSGGSAEAGGPVLQHLRACFRVSASDWLAGRLLACAMGFAQICTPSAHAQGLVPEDPAELAALPHLPTYRAFLPPWKDLSDGFPAAGDQGKQGSCVGWSVGYALRTYYEHLNHHTPLNNSRSLFSPSYVYNQIISMPGQCNSGSRISRALSLIQSQGISSISEFPYDPRNCTRIPDEATIEAARHHSISGFSALNAGNVDDAKGRIASGNPVAIGFNIDNRSMSGMHAGDIYDGGVEDPNFGHAVVLVGYDDSRQAFKFINSWGRGWGENGFGWLSYRVYRSSVRDAFTITDYAPEPPVPVVMDPPRIADWRDRVIAKSRGLQCAHIEVSSADARHGDVNGFVGSEVDLMALRKVVPDDVRAAFKVDVRPMAPVRGSTHCRQRVA